MKRRLVIAAFALLCIVQLAVPWAMVERQQRTLEEGTRYRFRTAPVDPADPFRGRYVALDFEAACVSDPRPGWEQSRGRAYASLAVDARGFAYIARLGDSPPSEGDYLRVRRHGWGCVDGGERVELPFDRYYLPEEMAPAAERAYNALSRRVPSDNEGDVEDPRVPAFATVRVRDGHATLEELYLEGQPVRDYVRAVMESAP